VNRRGLLAAAWLPWLGACAGLVTRPPPDLTGRLSIRVEAAEQVPSRSFSADFDLRGDAERGALRLTGPLGATLAELRWQPASAELVDAQGSRTYPTLDALAQELLGESLPMAALIAWLRGRPWTGASSRTLDDGFEQLGWRVGLAALADGLITASRERAPAVTVRARLERPS
jgi:outer membrane lipoprotein LolB